MSRRVSFKINLAGFDIVLRQQGRNRFEVQYGLQVRADLNYTEAALELGSAIMHASACEGRLDNRMPGERAGGAV